MSPGHARLRELLRSLDDPTHLEFPVGYEHRRTRDRFDLLVDRLDARFGCRCEVQRDIEGASLHGYIRIPAPATRRGHRLSVFVSNFGDLAVLAVDDPAGPTRRVGRGLLHPDDAGRVRGVLADLGYTLVPVELLRRPYDGVCAPDVFPPAGATWWIRFFDSV